MVALALVNAAATQGLDSQHPQILPGPALDTEAAMRFLLWALGRLTDAQTGTEVRQPELLPGLAGIDLTSGGQSLLSLPTISAQVLALDLRMSELQAIVKVPTSATRKGTCK